MDKLQIQEQQNKELLTFTKKWEDSILKINDCIEEMSIKRMSKEYGNDRIFISVVNLVVKKMELFNARFKMNDVQIGFFSNVFIEEFGHESVSDLSVCLTHGAMGKFGEIYNAIDPPTVFKWFRLHLDNKYQLKEQLMSKKKNIHLKESNESPVNQKLNKEWSKKIRQDLQDKKKPKKTLNQISKEKHDDEWNKIKPHLQSMDHKYLKELLKNFEKHPNQYSEEITEIKNTFK